ncbi:Hypothetical protein NocV09_01400450 [Nannochloropsis oceanica]
MPREVITLQVGQAGNQIGRRFWEQALEEHCQPTEDKDANEGGIVYTESMSSFFHHHDEEHDEYQLGSRKTTNCRHSSIVKRGRLKARAVLVDMEEGPVAETLRGPLGPLFDSHQYLTDVSGAGNNFAHGHYAYGAQYGDNVMEAVRGAAEMCDSLQSFFLMHSLGGGTGSGLGTYILGLLEDEFPNVHRFTTTVFPSEDDDVVTSPYNSMLALQQLTAHADCVLPVENQCLMDLNSQSSSSAVAGVKIVQPRQQRSSMHQLLSPPSPPAAAPLAPARGRQGRYRPVSAGAAAAAAAAAATSAVVAADVTGPTLAMRRECGFDGMNDIVARVLLDLTASMRFGGDLNVDLNEITTNLVPFPRLHYLMTSLSLYPSAISSSPHIGNHEWAPLGGSSAAHAAASLHLRTICSAVFSRPNQLLRSDPRRGTVLASALLFRGRGLSLADITENVKKIQKDIRMVSWNPDGFKIGLCGTPSSSSFPSSSSSSASVLSLSNNSCVATTFERMALRFDRLYRRKAMVHHYAEYMDASLMEEAREDLCQVIDGYRALEAGRVTKTKWKTK